MMVASKKVDSSSFFVQLLRPVSSSSFFVQLLRPVPSKCFVQWLRRASSRAFEAISSKVSCFRSGFVESRRKYCVFDTISSKVVESDVFLKRSRRKYRVFEPRSSKVLCFTTFSSLEHVESVQAPTRTTRMLAREFVYRYMYIYL